MPRIHLVSNLPGVNALGDHLRAAGLGPTSARSADALLVLIDRPLDHVEQDLLDRVRQSVPVLLAGPTVRALPPGSPLVEASGLTPGRVLPPHELRLLPGPHGGALMARAPRFVPRETWVIPEKVADDVERLILVRHELAELPICTWRPSSGLGMFTLGTSAAILGDPLYHRLVGRWLRHCLGVLDGPPAVVGLLGTPDTAAGHRLAALATEGLALTVVCDGLSARPPGSAASHLPRRVDDPDDLVNDPELDVVVVATPHHTHLEWAVRALEADKHVIVQAPLCLAPADADQLAELAAARSRLLAVAPAGLTDPGFETLAATLRRGAVGEPLRLEAHRGGLRRPAGSWHDDARVSGGQLFARATDAIEQILALVDGPVERVGASTIKRVWHHVSNADHTDLHLRFASGAQAQITVSDLTVLPRPPLEVLGTTGTLVLDARPAPGGASGAGFWAAGAVLPGVAPADWVAPAAEPAPRPGFLTGPGPVAGPGSPAELASGHAHASAAAHGPAAAGQGCDLPFGQARIDGLDPVYPLVGAGGPAGFGGVGAVPASGGGAVLLVTMDGVHTRFPIPVWAGGWADPAGPLAAFYRAVADRLVSGWPMTPDHGIETARPVVAVLAAAARSVASGGELVTPD
ncbi:putative oxidoreductase [Frankia sp. AiPs1]|uniref:Gfo/Idh/MocA family protein n=1 Tax=Frankia sp. AiPa1 TaxID=573492 RepID=UPI00202B2C92|nr:Gfo/Idh/MocA family oxidoreductase [Frankia sp. AiPa1]MCL9762336.1 Gfo/Idh/MocA family oxidoreductase [Frankia sp. AiPa1]